MEKTNINYIGMRRIYEQSQNQRAIDSLVHSYCEQRKTPQNASKIDSFLNGVTLSTEYINSITNSAEIIALIENGAYPKDKILERAKELCHDVSVIKYLYWRTLISIEDIIMLMSSLRKIDDTYFDILGFLLGNTDPEHFNKIDFATSKGRIANEFQKLIDDEKKEELKSIISKNIVVLLELLYKTTRSAYSFMITEYIIMCITYNNIEIIAGIETFIVQQIVRPRTKSADDLLIYFEHDYITLKLLKAIGAVDKKSYNICFNNFYEGFLGDFVNDVTDRIGKGSYSRIGFALRNFSEVFERRIDILNSWVANECEKELDVYGISLLQGEIPAESLDKEYLAALSGKIEQKTPQIKPVEPTDN